MIATSVDGMGIHVSTRPVSGAGIMREIVEGQGTGDSLGFNPPEASAGQSVWTRHWTKLAQVGSRDEVGGIFNRLKHWVECNG